MHDKPVGRDSMDKPTYEKPDYGKIMADVLSPHGAKLRTHRPKDIRAYFVWRLCRWYTGEDARMPILAECLIEGDPYAKELDDCAFKLAQVVNPNLDGLKRWGQIFGII